MWEGEVLDCFDDRRVALEWTVDDQIETVVAHDVIGRLMIQCALQPGLAQIWKDILGFENAEFYIKRWPQLDGLRFENVLISFPDAIPCGIKVEMVDWMFLDWRTLSLSTEKEMLWEEHETSRFQSLFITGSSSFDSCCSCLSQLHCLHCHQV